MRRLWTNESSRRLLLITLAALLTVAVVVRSVVDYRTERMQELKDRYETKRMEYDRYARLLANRDMFVKMQAELDSVQKGVVGTRFLTAPSIALAEVRFQDLVDAVAKKNGLSIISRKMLKAVDTGDLKEMRVSISCRTEIGVLNDFLYDIAAQDAAMFVESMDIKRLGDSEERFYNFNAVLKAYSL